MDVLIESIVKNTLALAEELGDQVEKMPEERRSWKPLDEGRSALDILEECAEVNERWAEILKTRKWIDARPAQPADLEILRARLVASATAFCDAVTAIDASEYEETIDLPWGKSRVAMNLVHALWHMSYHEGQINYIQTLYGDKEE